MVAVKNDDSANYMLNYNRIPAFCTEFMKQNEGSIAEYQVEPDSKVFKTLTVVLKLPFFILQDGGIPSAAVDGAHSRHLRWKGMFLSLTGRESWQGRNMVIGIMACSVENAANYTQFGRLVQRCLGEKSNVLNETYMLWSDRDKGTVMHVYYVPFISYIDYHMAT